MLTEEESRKLSSLLGALKGTIIQNIHPNNYEVFVKWCSKLALDTQKDKLEKALLKQIRQEKNPETKLELIEEKKKYLPRNYPSKINIGDIVHVNFGYGYCSEISDGHYGIILSEMKANMYLVIPCSSEPLRIMEAPIKLGVPNKEHNNDKISYLRFDQIRMIHYRRIEKVSNGKPYNVGNDKVREINQKVMEFFNFNLDKEEGR